MSPLTDSFRGHGTFLYNLQDTIDRRGGSVEELVRSMQRCSIRHAWIRVHGRRSLHGDPNLNGEVVAALRDAGIAVAAWGWCQGDEIEAEIDLALEGTRRLGLSDYVADIEEGVAGAHWSTHEVIQFLEGVRSGLPEDAGLAVSTFCLIDWHEPELMRAAAPVVDAFAPQVYWFFYPSAKMVRNFPGDYTAGDPCSYMDLCVDRWRALADKPLIVTGQAYWGEMEDWDQAEAERKMADFAARFQPPTGVVGLNWWHFGEDKAMSETMVAALEQRNLAALFPPPPAANT